MKKYKTYRETKEMLGITDMSVIDYVEMLDNRYSLFKITTIYVEEGE